MIWYYRGRGQYQGNKHFIVRTEFVFSGKAFPDYNQKTSILV